ncbi:class I SAM-dependent methyltransferase [Flagellimonas sp. S3867]|uniref:class I SAM-dependent methyltransferase n=1 Tax=Flagellimonas sp. S3867 TaxID=2768063 RepID=UPI001681CCDA|nr:class I SAM-dependent methyltransferase [Flagellimonas sp. S3867]
MTSKQRQSKLRSKLFQHLDGIVVGPAAFVLKENKATDYLLTHKSVDIDTMASDLNANNGYLNVALRTLCSQGWLVQHVDNDKNRIKYEINDLSKAAFNHFDMYREAIELLRMSEKFHPRKFEMEPFLKLEKTFESYKENFGVILSDDIVLKKLQNQILAHIEGIMVGPTLVRLGMTGMFHKYFMETRFKAEEFHRDPNGFERLLNILAQLNWFEKEGDFYKFTEDGLFFAKRASAYGVTVSYIPTLRNLDKIIFGNPLLLKNTGPGEEEKHVDREMNVWGSGGAHASYFKVIDDILIEIFNKPINEQPKGILDMGCGNGAFLKHVYTVIADRTYRGTILDEHPLMLIGADYNEAALKASKENLIQAEIWAKIIWGDIGNPQLLASDLKDKYGIALEDLLNVRTFLDHNRIWETPEQANKNRISSSTGAYVFEGIRLNNNLVCESLKQHFKKWLPYVKKFGLLLIELHTVPPELIAQNMGKTAATAYDATHGYSDQYIIEIDEFLAIMKEVGLKSDKDKSLKYPNSDLATVSINLFKA